MIYHFSFFACLALSHLRLFGDDGKEKKRVTTTKMMAMMRTVAMYNVKAVGTEWGNEQ